MKTFFSPHPYKIFVLALLAATVACAQTKVTVPQTICSTPTSGGGTTGLLVAVATNTTGAMKCFRLDPAVFSVNASGDLTITVPSPGPVTTPVKNELLPTDGVKNSFILSGIAANNTVVVFENGLHLEAGVDFTVAYNVTTTVVTFITSPVAQSSDRILVDYQKTN